MQEGPNPYQAPATAVPVPQPSPPRVQPAAAIATRALFAPPALKLVLMTFGTLGLYLVYWFYRNWKTIREVEGSEAWPFWRAVFSPIWSYGCFRAMASIAEGRRRELAFSPGMLALAYFLLKKGPQEFLIPVTEGKGFQVVTEAEYEAYQADGVRPEAVSTTAEAEPVAAGANGAESSPAVEEDAPAASANGSEAQDVKAEAEAAQAADADAEDTTKVSAEKDSSTASKD